MMTSRRMFFAHLAAGVTQAQDVTFTAGVKVVNLLAAVRTKKGQLVADLVQEDFSIFENGRPQVIRYFSKESDLPLTIGLLVDTSLSQRRVLDAERGASFRFLEQVLREKKDQIFVVQFDLAVMVRQTVTSSRRQLNDVLSLVDTPTRGELEMQRGGGTLLYDAIVKASAIMRDQGNRKALILLTDGVDTGSEATLPAAVEAAQRADTLIYAIEFSDATYYGGLGEPGGGAKLQRMARETGGAYLEVSKKHGIEEMFDLIQAELRSQYSLGYVSDDPVRVSEFRKVRVATRTKGLVVQTREKYWAQR